METWGRAAMAFITGSPSQEPRSSEEASEEEAPARRGSPPPAESDLELARRLQAEEEQGRPVARFKQLDCVEARYKDPELRGGTWSREYYLATVVDVIAPKTRSRAHEYMLRWDDGAEDQLVLEDYIRPAPALAPAPPAPEAPAAAPREHDGLPKSGLANGLRTGGAPPKKRGRPSKKGGRQPKPAAATEAAPPAPAPERAVPFVAQLKRMIEERPEIIRWRRGDIVIPDPAALERNLSKYYNHSKYASFQRQLNNFGYRRRFVDQQAAETVYERQGASENLDDLLALRPVRPAPGGAKKRGRDEPPASPPGRRVRVAAAPPAAFDAAASLLALGAS